LNKKIVILLLALALFSGLAFGESYSKKGMLIAPESLNANVGLGLGYGYGFGLGGGIEYGIGKFVIGEAKIPFTYGVAARAGLGLGTDINLSVGALGTLHFCWANFGFPKDLRWMGNFDSYLGLGLAFKPGYGLGFNSIGGLSYFFDKGLAVNLEAGLSASYIGILFKF